MTLFLLACSAATATFVGGLFALKFRDRLHLILGFSAGAVAGVALFDLLPEAIALGAHYYEAETIALFVALGFFGYLILDRMILLHTHEDNTDSHLHRGTLGAVILAAHSFLDGVAIGISFQVSAVLGSIVTAAILTHDFSDGINTVNLILRNGGDWRQAFRWLLIDAVAPVLGVVLTIFFIVPESIVGLVLAIFVGTFLYLSASDLIPESHHRHPRILTTIMTLCGALTMYLVVSLV